MMLFWGPHFEIHWSKAFCGLMLYNICLDPGSPEIQPEANTYMLIDYWGMQFQEAGMTEKRNGKQGRRANKRCRCVLLSFRVGSHVITSSAYCLRREVEECIYQFSPISHIQFINATPRNGFPTFGCVTFLSRQPLDKPGSADINLPEDRCGNWQNAQAHSRSDQSIVQPLLG